MNRIILSIFALGLCFTVGHALQCYKCDLGIWNLCLTSSVTCSSGQQCFSGVGTAAGFVDIKTKGCLALGSCNQTTTTSFPAGSNTTVYSLTKTCCNYDLCNGAPGLPRATFLTLALGTLITLFMTKVLV
ncbi:sperm acrosome membrane-associated protein 4 [Esox lucius]|uniref:UPAR/Ly6 domain-containing protein n=1 Tax=Esox lucius TaxID=8010 RepID=A0A3P8ZNH0_ESOLU|nr:sperm acrosome membrane-associated protein 4 [Esox lucius]